MDTLRQVILDVRWFLGLLLLTLLGFAFAFYILFRADQETPQFATLPHTMLTMFSYMMGDFDVVSTAVLLVCSLP